VTVNEIVTERTVIYRGKDSCEMFLQHFRGLYVFVYVVCLMTLSKLTSP
jgi:hypothetical protein